MLGAMVAANLARNYFSNIDPEIEKPEPAKKLCDLPSYLSWVESKKQENQPLKQND